MDMERQYLNLAKKVLEFGTARKSRNAQVLSLFGEKLTADISKEFPLLTTKRVHFNSIFYELQWFLRGETNNQLLREKGVKIWEMNSSKEFLRQENLPYMEGICGPIYGWQWRRFGQRYKYICRESGQRKKTRGVREGEDQVLRIQEQLRQNPNSRRLLLSGWNPVQEKEMCLPPCHVLYQFYVTQTASEPRLSCQMYQRSSDVFLGLPFNIASTALFCALMAQSCKMVPGHVHICIGDAHIYEIHREAVQKQLQREPRPLPKLRVLREKKNVWEYEREDVALEDYSPWPRISSPMVA